MSASNEQLSPVARRSCHASPLRFGGRLLVNLLLLKPCFALGHVPHALNRDFLFFDLLGPRLQTGAAR